MASFRKQLLVASTIKRIAKELNGVVQKSRDAVADTLFTQAALLASEIRSVAPVDPTSETPGALKASVRVEEGKPTPNKAIVVAVKAGNATTKKDSAGGAYDYGRAVEFGTQNMPAQPFFFPIYRARRKGIRQAVKKKIKGAVKDTFK